MIVPFSASAAFAAIVFLTIGIAVAWLLSKHLKSVEGSSTLALILLPLLAYLVFSGTLESFKGGGLEWKIRAIGSESIANLVSKESLSSDDFVKISADSTEIVNNALFGIPVEVILLNYQTWSLLSESNRAELSIRVGETIYHSLLSGSFKALIILDQDNRPIGLFEREVFLDLLRVPYTLYTVKGTDTAAVATPSTVRQMLQQTELWIILQHPKIRAEASGSKALLSSNTSRIDAIKQMNQNNWAAAAVTDPRGILKGTLWKSQLTEKLVIETIDATSN